MSIGDVRPIPNSFLSRLLGAYGVEWTHLTIFSGAVVSALGLQEYLSPGIWILGTVFAFGLVYLFRPIISGNFPLLALCSGCVMGADLGAPFWWLWHHGVDVTSFLKIWSPYVTGYVAFGLGVPLGVAILSYRKQDEFQREPLPEAIAATLTSVVANADIILQAARYEIQFTLPSPDEVTMRFRVEMEVHNRHKTEAQIYRDIFDPAGRNLVFHDATIDGVKFDLNNRTNWSAVGLTITRKLPPGATVRVMVDGASTFHARDSELVGVYLPAALLEVLIRRPPPCLNLQMQYLLPHTEGSQRRSNEDLLFVCDSGVLPYQGMRLFWEVR